MTAIFSIFLVRVFYKAAFRRAEWSEGGGARGRASSLRLRSVPRSAAQRRSENTERRSAALCLFSESPAPLRSALSQGTERSGAESEGFLKVPLRSAPLCPRGQSGGGAERSGAKDLGTDPSLRSVPWGQSGAKDLSGQSAALSGQSAALSGQSAALSGQSAALSPDPSLRSAPLRSVPWDRAERSGAGLSEILRSPLRSALSHFTHPVGAA